MFDVLLHMLYRLTCGYFILLYLCCIVFLRLVFSFSLSSSLSSGYYVGYIVNSNGSNGLFWCFFVYIFSSLTSWAPAQFPAPRGCCQSCPRCARCACHWGDAWNVEAMKIRKPPRQLDSNTHSSQRILIQKHTQCAWNVTPKMWCNIHVRKYFNRIFVHQNTCQFTCHFHWRFYPGYAANQCIDSRSATKVFASMASGNDLHNPLG